MVDFVREPATLPFKYLPEQGAQRMPEFPDDWAFRMSEALQAKFSQPQRCRFHQWQKMKAASFTGRNDLLPDPDVGRESHIGNGVPADTVQCDTVTPLLLPPGPRSGIGVTPSPIPAASVPRDQIVPAGRATGLRHAARVRDCPVSSGGSF